ncbi:hypothetical protein DFH06DRAFT_1127871 [Mycena polygramma]|nr:hypothetical protein DFH06DRAFT_1127871 [Mycena polygramma]
MTLRKDEAAVKSSSDFLWSCGHWHASTIGALDSEMVWAHVVIPSPAQAGTRPVSAPRRRSVDSDTECEGYQVPDQDQSLGSIVVVRGEARVTAHQYQKSPGLRIATVTGPRVRIAGYGHLSSIISVEADSRLGPLGEIIHSDNKTPSSEQTVKGRGPSTEKKAQKRLLPARRGLGSNRRLYCPKIKSAAVNRHWGITYPPSLTRRCSAASCSGRTHTRIAGGAGRKDVLSRQNTKLRAEHQGERTVKAEKRYRSDSYLRAVELDRRIPPTHSLQLGSNPLKLSQCAAVDADSHTHRHSPGAAVQKIQVSATSDKESSARGGRTH